MSYPKEESAKWAQATSQVVGEYEKGRDKLLDAAAARGFAAPPGDVVMDLFQVGQETKAKLAAANGKIYDERRGIVFQQVEFFLKLMVQVGKLAMELYREEIFNALSLEAAEEDAFLSKGKADIECLNIQTEARQIAIIKAKAEIEHDIAGYKRQLVAAERVTMDSEYSLVVAQLATARKKLEIIASIYQVLAAEKLVLVAEHKKVSALQLVLAAEQIVAEVKREMIPIYITKAQAKEALAAAITAEIPIHKAIEELGYQRIDLKDAEMLADHIVREAEEEAELARAAFTRASTALEFIRTQGRRLLAEYSNTIKQSIQTKRQLLEEEGIDLRLSSSLAREAINVKNEVSVTKWEIQDLTAELAQVISNMGERAADHAATVQASATQIILNTSTTTQTDEISVRRIFKG